MDSGTAFQLLVCNEILPVVVSLRNNFSFLIHFNFGQQLTSGFVQVRRTEKQSAAIHFSALVRAGQATLNSKS